MRITIGIPTKNRQKSLARLLASLHGQSYGEWDLVIVNDGVGDALDKVGKWWAEKIRNSGHSVRIVTGARINQAYNHNWVLWARTSADHILRLDDDVVLSPDYLEILVQNWTTLVEQDINVGAVSGTFFTEHIRKRDGHPPVPTSSHQTTGVGRGGGVGPNAFMQEYSDNELIECQHLYSSCLYSKAAMQHVGGWALDYSRDVSYHEETDGTFRLHLAGYKLFLVPEAKAIHSHEDTGGTRAMSATKHGQKRASDWALFKSKTVQLRGINPLPKIALYSDHRKKLGGGRRLVNTMMLLLDELLAEGCIGGWYFLDSDGMDGLKDRENHVDVLISIGHTPPPVEFRPMNSRHIHYSFFPVIRKDELPSSVTRYVAISQFSAGAVQARFRRDAEYVYPCADGMVEKSGIEKENLVLIVGRRDKGAVAMVNAWSAMVREWPGGSGAPELCMVSPEFDADLERLATDSGVPNISYRWNVTDDELSDLYKRAKVLWAGRGFGVPDHIDASKSAEHFGYTPVDAIRHYCVPVAYNAGGYRETTLLRFETAEELIKMTFGLLTDFDFWDKSLLRNREHMDRFSWSRFYSDWKRIILGTNFLAWSKDMEWRGMSRSVSVADPSLHVAYIGQHPLTNDGFGVVGRETLKGLREEFKVHVFGFNDHRPDINREYSSLWPSPRKYDGGAAMRDFLRHRHFDAAYISWDAANTSKFATAVRAVRSRRIPIVSYTSQESYPASDHWEHILATVDRPIAYCKAAADAIERRFGKRVDYAYLGADHAKFRRYPDPDRRMIRHALGLDDKFVIFVVAANKRHKRIAAAIDLIAYMDTDECALVLRTDKVGIEGQQGINVEQRSKLRGVSDLVRLVPESPRGLPYETDIDRVLRSAPDGPMGRADWSRTLGMIDWYNVADLFLDLSGAEGWGLPTFEALACGLPVVSVDDGFVRLETLLSCWSAVLVPGVYTSEWVEGADLKMVDLADASESIRAVMDGPVGDGSVSPVSIAYAAKFSWDAPRKAIRDALMDVCTR